MYISHTTIKQSARSMANDMTQTLTHSIPLYFHIVTDFWKVYSATKTKSVKDWSQT